MNIPDCLGNYKVRRSIGRGGWGEVFECTHIIHGGIYAAKVLLHASKQADDRFKREVEMISRLEHPHIVKIIDYDIMGEVKYFVMPYLAYTFADHLKQQMPVKSALAIIRQIASALHYLHEESPKIHRDKKITIHRDVTPKNIMYDEQNQRWVLVDFGIIGYEESTKTLNLYAPRYASWEQREGIPLDKRSDICQLGFVLSEALSGELPIRFDDNGHALGSNWNHAQFMALPSSVQELIRKMCAEKRALRFADAAKIIQRIDQILTDSIPEDETTRTPWFGNSPPNWPLGKPSWSGFRNQRATVTIAVVLILTLIGVLILPSRIGAEIASRAGIVTFPITQEGSSATPTPPLTMEPEPISEAVSNPPSGSVEATDTPEPPTPTLMPTFTATALPTSTPDPQCVALDELGVNLRTGPYLGSASNVLVTMPKDTSMKPIARYAEGDWLFIQRQEDCQGQCEGWVYSGSNPQILSCTGIDLSQLPTASTVPTAIPTAALTATPVPPSKYKFTSQVQCQSYQGATQFDGIVYERGAPINGYKIVFSYKPDGEFATQPVVSGYGHPSSHLDWKPGYYIHIIRWPGQTTSWYVWIIDDSGTRISEIANWANTGPEGSCNRAVINFYSQ